MRYLVQRIDVEKSLKQKLTSDLCIAAGFALADENGDAYSIFDREREDFIGIIYDGSWFPASKLDPHTCFEDE